MKNRISTFQAIGILFLLLFLYSCNTYRWQRKRYYQSDKNKNWNNYNPEKAKKDQENELKKYYKK